MQMLHVYESLIRTQTIWEAFSLVSKKATEENKSNYATVIMIINS